MDSEKLTQIQAHAQAIAALLYSETEKESVQTLAGIEEVVRNQILEHVAPEVGNFLSKKVVEREQGENG